MCQPGEQKDSGDLGFGREVSNVGGSDAKNSKSKIWTLMPKSEGLTYMRADF